MATTDRTTRTPEPLTTPSHSVVTTGVLALAYGVLVVGLVTVPVMAAVVLVSVLSLGLIGVLSLWLLSAGMAGIAPRIARTVLRRTVPVRSVTPVPLGR